MTSDQLFTRLSSWGRKPDEADRANSLELAVSARRFSRQAQAVLDDKLSFSATLMRAGEVEAANRLLAEVGEEVLSEEVALLERVNEVKMARSLQQDARGKVTRGRLARTLAVAMLGSSLLAFSAAGAVVVGLFKDNDQAIHGADPDRSGTMIAGDRVMGTRQVKLLDNVSLPMTSAQFRRYTQLTQGDIDEQELELFLLRLMPQDLAEKVHYALVTGLDVLPDPVSKEIIVAVRKIEDPRQQTSSSRSDDQPAPSGTDAPRNDQPSPQPSDSEPSEEESPSPDESPGDNIDVPLLDDGDGGDEG